MYKDVFFFNIRQITRGQLIPNSLFFTELTQKPVVDGFDTR